MRRSILHSDCNSFYASVECLHHPELRNKPVSVGGDEEHRHGIILASNPLAKKYGIKTGEALWQAKQKCRDLTIVPANFPLYMRFSRLVREIYMDYSNQVEPFGLDECWLDVTGSTQGSGLEIAEAIRARIKVELGITVSIGVSDNKIFAKLGSDYKKPDATTVIDRENYQQIAWPLPAGDLLYVGSATKKKLRYLGIHTIGDIAAAPMGMLESHFGKWGSILHCFSNGLDASPVCPFDAGPVVKSIGNSTTAIRDLENDEDVKIILYVLADSVGRRLREQGMKGRTVCISVRDNALYSFTRQSVLMQYSNVTDEIAKRGMELFRANYRWQKPVRSVGISITDLVPDTVSIQTNLFSSEPERERRERLDGAVDGLKNRFGTASVQPAVLLKDKALSGFDPKTQHTIHPVGYF